MGKHPRGGEVGPCPVTNSVSPPGRGQRGLQVGPDQDLGNPGFGNGAGDAPLVTLGVPAELNITGGAQRAPSEE